MTRISLMKTIRLADQGDCLRLVVVTVALVSIPGAHF
jgi:hypothetical protein